MVSKPMMEFRKYTTLLVFAMLPLMASAQAKKPTLMVVPAEAWCHERGYVKEDDKRVDYEKALRSDADLVTVISKIGELMADRGFPLKDLGQTFRQDDATPQRADADIMLEVMWKVNKVGPRQSVTYTLRGLDAYTLKQVAAAGGTGMPSIACEVPVLLEEAVLEQMDDFQAQLQQHFDDLLENGREVNIGVRATDGALTMDSDLEAGTLVDVIDEWMAQNTVNHRYNLSENDDTSLLLEQVRIPLFDANGTPMDTRRFANGLRRHLMSQGLKVKTVSRGLGRADLEVSRQ